MLSWKVLKSRGNTNREPKRITTKILLVGYNGANNTGSEARLLAIIDDVRTVFGPDALITVPSLNERNLRRYLKEEPNLRIVPIPPIFFFTIRKLVKEHDMLLLVEGSCYMDTWTSALLWAFLWASRCAHVSGKPSMAYAVDAGELSSFNRRLVSKIASKTDLIIVRTREAACRLRSWGVSAPIKVTADCAFTFETDKSDNGLLRREWADIHSGLIGFAVVDFFLWPVVIRPWGKKENCYRWPYYYSSSRWRSRARDNLANNYASIADILVEKYGKSIAFICMEELDEPFACEVHHRMRRDAQAKVFCSKKYNASQMTVLLRSLELLVTSRYHAGVLSLAAQVPQIAVGHDIRLKSFYADLGILDEFFIAHEREDMSEFIIRKIEELLESTSSMREKLQKGYREHVQKAHQNRRLLRAFANEHALGSSV